MIRLRFYNSLGEVVFDKNGWHLTEAEGLCVPSKSLSGVRYINQPGQSTTYCIENPRTITLSGDINLAKAGEGEFGRACAVFGMEGTLEVETDRYKRIISARCMEFVPGERNGIYRCFVVQFLCDVPFFEDAEYTDTVVYEREPLLSKDTVLPAVFSTRIAKGDVFYPGSAWSEPVFYIRVPSGEGEVSIENHTTGGRISVRYDNSLFSQLIIDVKNRTITDENGISRLELLTDDSFFDGFILRSGKNSIEVINSDVENDIGTRMKYKVRYQEAVI